MFASAGRFLAACWDDKAAAAVAPFPEFSDPDDVDACRFASDDAVAVVDLLPPPAALAIIITYEQWQELKIWIEKQGFKKDFSRTQLGFPTKTFQNLKLSNYS